MMHTRTLVAVPLILLALAGCSAKPDSSNSAMPADPAETKLEGARIGGPFTLIDQDGKPRNWSEFTGKYRVVYFGYSYCPDVCPVDLQRIAQGYRLFAKDDPARAAKVQPIFITVDPRRDTPDVLKRYVANFHPRLIGLTGTEQEIQQVATAHGGSALPDEPNEAGGYNVNHTRFILLMGPDNAPIAIVPHDQGAEGVSRALDQWVR